VPNELPLKYIGPPTHAAIAAADMMTRLYILADDSMMGRSAATPDNAKGALYIEREVRRLGLKPAGENGTYFQFPLDQREIDPATSLSIDGKALRIWTDFAPRDQGPGARPFDGVPVIYAGSLGDPQRLVPRSAAAGKIALVTVAKDSLGRGNFTVNRGQLTSRFFDAAAIAVVSIDYLPPGYIDQFYRVPLVAPKGVVDRRALPNYFYVTKAVARAMLGRDAESAQPGTEGGTVHGQIRYVVKQAPARNVAAIIPGSDPTLRGEYVAIGAHNDHVGYNNDPADHDSVKAYQLVARPQGADSDRCGLGAHPPAHRQPSREARATT